MDEEIFRISKSMPRAKSLMDMAVDRMVDIKNEKKTYKIVEEYYEVIKELATALMYADGFKTLSHKSLFSYLEINYPKSFSREEIGLMDEIRKLRNEILYYGKQVDSVFLTNHEENIKSIIKKLLKLAQKKLI